MSGRVQRQSAWPLGLAALILGMGLCFIALYPDSGADAPWTLQVVARMNAGETLYRDIFCGVMPLGFYVLAIVTRLFGLELIVVRAGVMVCFLASWWLAHRILCRLSQASGHGHGLMLGAWMSLCALPREGGIYQPLATVFLLGCFHAVLRLSEAAGAPAKRGRDTLLGAAGVGLWAGLCFSTKQNLGVYALGASLVVILCGALAARAHRAWWLLLAAVLCLSFLLVVLAVSLPVYLSGGLEKLIEYGFVNKRRYLAVAGRSYAVGLEQLLKIHPLRPWWRALNEWSGHLIFVVPLLAAVALAWIAVANGRQRWRQSLVVIVFVAVFWAGIYPRADAVHMLYMAPGSIIAIGHAWHLGKPRLAGWRLLRSCWGGVGLLVLGGLGLKFVLSLVEPCPGDCHWSTLPHLRYTRLSASYEAQLAAQTAQLRMAPAPMLILAPKAGFYYLISGIKNPTPFDYPLATAFGLHGEHEVIAALDAGRIRSVCMQKSLVLPPRELETYVERKLKRQASFGKCDYYTK